MINSKSSQMGRIRRIHFVGIGGSGMGGIAEVLLSQGYNISGSDLSHNAVTQHLQKLGATIKRGHYADNCQGADVVVFSSAVAADNVELVAARNARIPVIPRAQMLAELMRFYHGIAIAGTHGKTTTTSLITHLLVNANLDPTFIIGGLLNSSGTHGKLGSGHYLVAEADESDASFLCLQPKMAIVTNIDNDHTWAYDNDFNRLRQSFIDFLHRLPFYGLAVLCIDDEYVRDILPEVSRPVLTYGFSEDADVQALDFYQKGTESFFTLNYPAANLRLPITLSLPGRHNVLNALAAIAIAKELGIENDSIVASLASFQGVGRRFQVYGEFAIGKAGKVLLVDDYGHHPREIMATIKAAREAWPERRLVMAYQPHRYTRTHALFADFVDVLAKVDQLILLDVYAAGERPINGVDGPALVRAITENAAVPPIFMQRVSDLPNIVLEVLRNGDLLLTQGAGDIGGLAQKLMRM